MGSAGLHPYDVVMLVILAVATFFGLWKGFAWQVASVASFVLSYWVAVQASGWLAPLLSVREPWNHLVAMLILFVATSAAVWLVFRLVAGVIDKIQLKAFDRQLGALLGLLKGVLICLVVTFFAVTLSETLRQEVLRARSGYYIALLIDRINPILPTEVRDLVGQYLEELDRRLQPSSEDGKNAPENSPPGFLSPTGTPNVLPGLATPTPDVWNGFPREDRGRGEANGSPPSGPSEGKDNGLLAPLAPIR